MTDEKQPLLSTEVHADSSPKTESYNTSSHLSNTHAPPQPAEAIYEADYAAAAEGNRFSCFFFVSNYKSIVTNI